MHQFQTRHSELDGFSDFYEREVAPVLRERDVDRKRDVRNGIVGGGLLALIFGAAAAFIYISYEEGVFVIILID